MAKSNLSRFALGSLALLLAAGILAFERSSLARAPAAPVSAPAPVTEQGGPFVSGDDATGPGVAEPELVASPQSAR